jgi:hypothetical protein
MGHRNGKRENANQVRLVKRSAAYWQVTFDHPPFNIFDPETIPQLNEIVTALAAGNLLKIVVFDSAVEGFFLTHYDFLAKREDSTNLPPGPTGLQQLLGEKNFFLFGLTADQVASSRSWYNPHWHYENEPETRAPLDLIFSDHFNRDPPGLFEPLRCALFTQGDYYMHLADQTAYVKEQERLGEVYACRDEWARRAILNVAGSGTFSSNRTSRNMPARSGD